MWQQAGGGTMGWADGDVHVFTIPTAPSGSDERVRQDPDMPVRQALSSSSEGRERSSSDSSRDSRPAQELGAPALVRAGQSNKPRRTRSKLPGPGVRANARRSAIWEPRQGSSCCALPTCGCDASDVARRLYELSHGVPSFLGHGAAAAAASHGGMSSSRASDSPPARRRGDEETA